MNGEKEIIRNGIAFYFYSLYYYTCMPARLDNRHEIELAEGISVQLRPASMVPRVMARLIDVTLQSIVISLFSVALTFAGIFIGGEASSGVIMLVSFIGYWFYDVIFELTKKAASPGKRFMKLKVVKLSGAPTDFGSSFLRALLLPIDYLPLGLAGMISSIASKHSQRLGDLAAGTIVVYKSEELHGEMETLPVKTVRPTIPLKREEQLAFLEFGRRYEKLSVARQNEIGEVLDEFKGSAPSGMNYALGVANWLKGNEG